jgi:uncharacterized Zn-finger protein
MALWSTREQTRKAWTDAYVRVKHNKIIENVSMILSSMAVDRRRHHLRLITIECKHMLTLPFSVTNSPIRGVTLPWAGIIPFHLINPQAAPGYNKASELKRVDPRPLHKISAPGAQGQIFCLNGIPIIFDSLERPQPEDVGNLRWQLKPSRAPIETIDSHPVVRPSQTGKMLRASSRTSLRTVLRRTLGTPTKLSDARHGAAPRVPLHQPLGVAPPGTDADAVRSKWGSNAMDLVQKASVIAVKGPVAICDGGGGPLGHPLEYIQVHRADSEYPAICKYCGAKFVADH